MDGHERRDTALAMAGRAREKVRGVRQHARWGCSGPCLTANRRPHIARSGCRRLMFNARHTKFHSPRALAHPRTLKRRNPRTSLIQPLGASDSHLRCAYRSRPVGVASFSIIRCVAGCLFVSLSATRRSPTPQAPTSPARCSTRYRQAPPRAARRRSP